MQPINAKNTNDLISYDARPFIGARSVLKKGRKTFFDVRVRNTFTNSQSHLSPTKFLERHEKEKRQYNNHVMNIEHETFTLLVLFISGCVGEWVLYV